jgi:hypothetical protein
MKGGNSLPYQTTIYCMKGGNSLPYQTTIYCMKGGNSYRIRQPSIRNGWSLLVYDDNLFHIIKRWIGGHDVPERRFIVVYHTCKSAIWITCAVSNILVPHHVKNKFTYVIQWKMSCELCFKSGIISWISYEHMSFWEQSLKIPLKYLLL